MNSLAREDAAKVVYSVVAELLKVVTIDAGRPGSEMRHAAGDLIANAEALIEDGIVAAPLAKVFDLTRQAGASIYQIETVRRYTVDLVVKYNAALSVKNSAIRFALVQIARILAAMTFKSRPEVDRILDRVNDAFEQAEVVAGNSRDQASYRSIIALHAAVTFDLTTRARPLPQIVGYDFVRPKPALWISQRLYCEAGRVGELIDENAPVHPAFVQNPVRALSA